MKMAPDRAPLCRLCEGTGEVRAATLDVMRPCSRCRPVAFGDWYRDLIKIHGAIGAPRAARAAEEAKP